MEWSLFEATLIESILVYSVSLCAVMLGTRIPGSRQSQLKSAVAAIGRLLSVLHKGQVFDAEDPKCVHLY